MTRLASLCAGALEVANAIAVRLEDVIGEWVDGLGPRPERANEAAVADAIAALDRYIEARIGGFHPLPYRSELHAAVARLVRAR